VPKLLKAKKLRAPGRVYVSVLLDAQTKDHEVWVTKFYGRLELEVAGAPDRFEDVTGTNRGEAGELVDAPGGRTIISAVVSVLTDTYMKANVDTRKGPAAGELARFLDRALVAANVPTDDEVALDIFLAPLEEPIWTLPVRGIRLNDPRLTRLRETRFVLPSEGEGQSKDQIDAAARRIVIDPDEEGGETP
jgi:hypothetical protein